MKNFAEEMLRLHGLTLRGPETLQNLPAGENRDRPCSVGYLSSVECPAKPATYKTEFPCWQRSNCLTVSILSWIDFQKTPCPTTLKPRWKGSRRWKQSETFLVEHQNNGVHGRRHVYIRGILFLVATVLVV